MGHGESNFSARFGYRAPEAEISVREDAPAPVRDAVLMLGYDCGFGPSSMRDIVCSVMLRRPDQDNWSANNIEREVHQLIDEAPWFKVYDLAERLYASVARQDGYGSKADDYQLRLNDVFREHGVGWKMDDGWIVYRGSEGFEQTLAHAVPLMSDAGAPTAAAEIHEALTDISRRPEPDVTGAIQHAMAALECVARQYDGTTDTLGAIIGRLPLPKPMDEAVKKLWGFTSEQGRHIIEGRRPAFEEAELVVTTASALAVYLLRVKTR